MAERPATKTEILALGFIAAGIGLYFMLVGLGLLPIPGGPKNLHAPLWVVFAAGLAFALAGIAVLMHGFGYTNNDGEPPAGAPRWVPVFQYLMGLAIFASFGAIASWIAFVPGPREFTGSGFGAEAPVSAIVGRVGFGIGAIIIWLATIAVAVSGARKLRRGSPT